MHDAVYYAALLWMTGLLGVSAVLVLRASSAPSRILALDMVTLILVADLLLLTSGERTPLFLDAALVLALLSFTATLAACRYHSDGRLL
jgi:multicomponent Na+:H+ antiporter subunit F